MCRLGRTWLSSDLGKEITDLYNLSVGSILSRAKQAYRRHVCGVACANDSKQRRKLLSEVLDANRVSD